MSSLGYISAEQKAVSKIFALSHFTALESCCWTYINNKLEVYRLDNGKKKKIQRRKFKKTCSIAMSKEMYEINWKRKEAQRSNGFCWWKEMLEGFIRWRKCLNTINLFKPFPTAFGIHLTQTYPVLYNPSSKIVGTLCKIEINTECSGLQIS